MPNFTGVSAMPRRVGDLLDETIGHDHALWAAKAAKRGVADRMGPPGVRARLDVGIEIGVVGVKERAIRHGAGEVGRRAAARVQSP
jgi:hypothetical protein